MVAKFSIFKDMANNRSRFKNLSEKYKKLY